MIVQLNTDKNIQGTEKLESIVSDKINRVLKPYVDHITRVEVHLSDTNAHKTGKNDIQCKIEARMEGIQPVTAVSKDDSKEKALDSAVTKIKAALTTIVGKRRDL